MVPELLIIQLKRFRKVESSVEKIYNRVKFSLEKIVIGGKKYGLKGVIYHTGKPNVRSLQSSSEVERKVVEL